MSRRGRSSLSRKNESQVPGIASVYLSQDIIEALARYMDVNEMTSRSEAIRTIIVTYLTTAPEETMWSEKARAAFKQMRHFLIQEMMVRFKEVEKLLEESIKLSFESMDRTEALYELPTEAPPQR